MTMNTYASVSVSQGTLIYFEQKALKHAGPVMVLDKFGMTKTMPANKGTQIEFRRPRTFTAATTPLQEGVTPASRAFSYETVTGNLRQYGDLSTITDVIQDTHKDPVLNDLALQMGENIGRTHEALNWAVLRAGTSVVYANGAARNAVNTTVSVSKLRAAIRSLKAQKAMPITRMVGAGPNYGTKAIEPGYVAICHTDLESDIRNLPGFVTPDKYGQRQTIHPREFGSLEEIRFITSPDLDVFADAGGAAGSMVSTGGTSADVYPMLILGQEAYGLVSIMGKDAVSGVEPVIIPVNSRDKSDPLAQRGFVGWKGWHLCLILNDLWMVRLECAATDLS